MTNKLDSIRIDTEFKHLQIKEITDSGEIFRRVLQSNDTLAEDEHQEVKDRAEELWTDEVKEAWATFQAEQQAKMEAE